MDVALVAVEEYDFLEVRQAAVLWRRPGGVRFSALAAAIASGADGFLREHQEATD